MAETPPTRRRRWFQFRLRTLLIAMALLAIPMGWFGWQERIVRHRKALLTMIDERMRDTRSGFEAEIDDILDDKRPNLPWYRAIFGDRWEAGIRIDSHAFSLAEILQIRDAFPESDVNDETSLDANMNVWPGTIADSEREIKRGKSLETRLGIIPLPPSCLTGIQEACDDNVYVTHLATGRLYLFKTRVDPQRPREFGGYVYSTIPLNQLGAPETDGYIRIDATALDPGPSDPKAGATAVAIRAKRATKEGWLCISTCDEKSH